MRGGARGYAKAKARVQTAAEATGRLGQLAAITAALTMHVVKDPSDRWWELVADVESEAEKERRTERNPSPDPIMTVDEYITSPI